MAKGCFHTSRFLWLLVIGLLACQSSHPTATPELEEEQDYPINFTVLNYLKLNQFVHPEFPTQTLGDWARFEHIDYQGGQVYFSGPKSEDANTRLLEICRDTSQIEFSSPAITGHRLGPVFLKDTSRLLFSFPRTLFSIDSATSISRQLGKFTYELGLEELRDLHKNKTLYNSPAIFVRTDRSGARFSIANHMAPVALPSEPTLEGLIKQIIPDDMPMEEQIQNLLDFVTKEIQYDSHGRYEIFMKPHEILLSGKSDCSGKVVLFASLLEQIGHPYLLLYMDGHIAVGVPGNFSKSNNMNFEHEGTQYFVAETTLPGFAIGISKLQPVMTEDMFRYLQYPGQQSKLYQILTGDSLGFLEIYKTIKG